MKQIILILTLILTLTSCKKDLIKDGILMAEREAQIGYNHLRIFKDSTFEFEYTSFPNSKFHSGKIRILKDTIFFDYADSIPAFGNKAIIEGRYLIYTNGKYKETLEIWLDSISK